MVSRAVLALALAGLAVFAPAWAGEKDKKDPFEMGKPGPEHKILKELEGSFQAKAKAWLDPTKEPEESTGTMVRKIIMDGRFLQESYEGAVMNMPFRGLGLMGYDMQRKKYTSAWVDNLSTAIMTSQGTYDAAKKTFTFSSEDIDPYTGEKMKSRDVITLVSADEQRTEMFRGPAEGGKETKVLEIIYTRKK